MFFNNNLTKYILNSTYYRYNNSQCQIFGKIKVGDIIKGTGSNYYGINKYDQKAKASVTYMVILYK